LNKEYWDLLL